MSPESIAQSLAMLRQVLDGASYIEIARRAGVSRTLVEQRVKTVARELAVRMGVAGSAPHGPVLAAQLRRERSAYLEAIARFRLQDLPDARPRHAVLSDADIEHLVSVTRAHSKFGARDVALLYMLLGTGAKPLEVARLDVGDYLAKDGTVRVESTLRAQVAISGTARPLYFANAKLVAALDQYLAQRARAGQGAGRPGEYRGLAPDSKLFLSADGEPMTIRAEDHGGKLHHNCRAVLEIYRRIFRRAGLPGVSALSARRTVARRLAERGCDVEQAGKVLGITPRAVRHLLAAAPQPLRKLFSELL
jgi:integrase